MSSRTAGWVLTSLCLALLAGCGDDATKEEGTPADAYEALQSATIDGRASEFCELLTDDMRSGFAKEYSAPSCPEAFERFRDALGPPGLRLIRRIRVRDHQINGNRATVTVCCETTDKGTQSGPTTEQFTRSDGRWKLAE